jgi:hypothetical protein
LTISSSQACIIAYFSAEMSFFSPSLFCGPKLAENWVFKDAATSGSNGRHEIADISAASL